jgi:hypothetical protein
MTAKDRYIKAYQDYTRQKHPAIYNTGKQDYFKPTVPDTKKANGLTKFICNYLNWIGCRATRVSSAGRVVKAGITTEFGTKLKVSKFIPSTTRRGTADISSTIRGRSVMWEVKVGRDRPSEYQLAEQQREQMAGGLYFFVGTPDEFFDLLDEVLNN